MEHIFILETKSDKIEKYEPKWEWAQNVGTKNVFPP